MVNAVLGMGHDMTERFRSIEQRLRDLATQPVLLNASTGQDGGKGLSTDKDGLHVYNSSGVQVNTIQTSDGTLITYDTNGTPVARFGALLSNPGHYGGEIWDPVAHTWVQLVTGASVSWSSITGIPSTFPPSAHTHPGTDVTSAVADASGSSYGYNHAVGGTSFFALWVGNDAGNHLGTNTSSARYKRAIKRHRIDPRRVLKLRPVTYEKPANGEYSEYGLIAEQVLESGVPEIVQWMDGKVHGLRYDLLAVALLEVVKEQEKRITALEQGGKHQPAKAWHEPHHKANNPPPHPEPLHPYTIEED